MPKTVAYDLRPCRIEDVAALCAKYHGYGGAGNQATYAFGVYEQLYHNNQKIDRIVAAYAWQPPAPGSSSGVCKECPQGVLSLSRMVAVPRDERRLQHISKPLRRQMLRLIDRTRWPVLVTYSDEGQGHTGHVYKCSGWKATIKSERNFYVDANGVRSSSYNDGRTNTEGLTLGGKTTIQRWEHWICDDPLAWMTKHGWRKQPMPGRRWRSGAQAYTYVRDDPAQVVLFK